MVVIGTSCSRGPAVGCGLSLVEQEVAAYRADLEVFLAAEAEAKLDREGQRLEELKREVETAIGDEQAQAQQQEAEVEAETETTTH